MLFVNACDFKFTQSFCDIPYVDFWKRPGIKGLYRIIFKDTGIKQSLPKVIWV